MSAFDLDAVSSRRQYRFLRIRLTASHGPRLLRCVAHFDNAAAAASRSRPGRGLCRWRSRRRRPIRSRRQGGAAGYCRSRFAAMPSAARTAGRLRGANGLGPGNHQRPALVHEVASRVRRLGLGPDRLRKRRLHDRMRRMGLPGRMIAEARSEPVRDWVDTPHPSYRRCGSLAKFRPEAPREGRQEIRYPCRTNGPERSQGNRLNAVCCGQDARAPGRPAAPRRPCPRAELRS